jgi:transposase
LGLVCRLQSNLNSCKGQLHHQPTPQIKDRHMIMTQDIIGVDIAKDWIDIHRLSSGQSKRIASTGSALARFAAQSTGSLLVLEASGGYERPLTEVLAEAGVPFARVNPRQAREFARATGRLAKTDRVDAAMLAEMGRALRLEPSPPRAPERVRLADLMARRDDLSDMRRREANRLKQARDAWVRKDIKAVLRALERRLVLLDAEISAQIEADETLARAAARLQSMPGIGPVIAASLVAWLPELGRLDRRAIASLAGLAPHACDSGVFRGKRRVWGGRAEVRRSLYLAGFIASRYDPRLRAFRKRLEAGGKPAKVAIVAVARKLLTILNAMFRDGKDYKAA